MTSFVRTPLTGHDCKGFFQCKCRTHRGTETISSAQSDGQRGRGRGMPNSRALPADITRCRPTAPNTEIQLRASLIKEVKTRRACPPVRSPTSPVTAQSYFSVVPFRERKSNIYLTTADEREDFATPPPYFILAPLPPPRRALTYARSHLRTLTDRVRLSAPPFVCEKVPLIICKARSPGGFVNVDLGFFIAMNRI